MEATKSAASYLQTVPPSDWESEVFKKRNIIT
jgi:hypothetical protein